MLTFTAILVGLMLFTSVCRALNNEMRTGWDFVTVLLGLTAIAAVVWQFYFVMLPLAWYQ